MDQHHDKPARLGRERRAGLALLAAVPAHPAARARLAAPGTSRGDRRSWQLLETRRAAGVSRTGEPLSEPAACQMLGLAGEEE